MDASLTLLNARIEFLETKLALIHIPLELYSSFIQPILQLLLPSAPAGSNKTSNGGPVSSVTNGALSEHPFTNISVTPIECSIACSRQLATSLFLPIQSALPPDQRESVSITQEDYVVMQVDGEGLDAGQRVLELTSPLAMAGISIFFVTTYFSDYIIVPIRSRQKVIAALEARGFAFDSAADTTSYTHRITPSGSSFDMSGLSIQVPSLPGTPPPATITELEARTFATLKKRNVIPTIDPTLRLVQCAARKLPSHTSSASAAAINSAMADRLNLALVRCLLTQPRFLSLTLTESEPASLLLEQHLLSHFDMPTSSSSSSSSSLPDSLLLGSGTSILNPIILDLRTLPVESVGIVCGVAGRLVGGTRQGWMEPVEMSYLSTARAGTVMVAEEEAERAVGALGGWSGNGNGIGNGEDEGRVSPGGRMIGAG